MKNALTVALIAATLFASAGRMDLPFLWSYVAVRFAVCLVSLWMLDPGLQMERESPGTGGRDRNLPGIAGLLIFVHLLCAGLDVGRYHWSDTVPAQMQIAGLIGLIGSHSLTLWAMRANRYFSPVVRIQDDRGHGLVCDGPYRWVRHPGYFATLVWLTASGFVLGSYLSMVPLAIVLLLLIRRVVIEDRFLHEQLAGYRDYADRVRHRLIPHVW
jgi:protein-S-isoprenylcysteine O-methyltransferase Ste14